MTRGERERLICRRVAERVRKVAPEGIGHWDPAWDYVAAPSDRFLDALDVWLGDDNEETRSHLQAAADDLIQAWMKAGHEYESMKQPRDEVPA